MATMLNGLLIGLLASLSLLMALATLAILIVIVKLLRGDK